MKLKIQGMHCASCEVLIERQFKKIPGVEKVSVNHAKGEANIRCTREPSLREFQEAIEDDGYTVLSEVSESAPKTSSWNLGALVLLVAIFYLLFKRFDLLPTIDVSQNMSYGVAFATGLVAALSSCMAVAGGLLLTLSAKYSEAHPHFTGMQKFKPTLYFNVGRLVSYTGFGALIGWLGSGITLSSQWNGILTILVSVVMILLGFQLLHVFPSLRRFQPKMPKWFAHKIHDLSEQGNKAGPFALGALTFFLPCGFTQALQLYVLSQGDATTGALTMLAFSLGTLPALLSLSAISSFLKDSYRQNFLKLAGVLIVFLGISNINSGLLLAGWDISLIPKTDDTPIAATQEDGKQIVEMSVNGLSYSPTHFTVQAGVPVEWRIDASGAIGCGQVLVMPTLNFSKLLSKTEINVITFIPTETGEIPFNCSMGMMTPGSFTVTSNS